MKTLNKYGIEGLQAPELNVPVWIDGEGQATDPVSLKDYEGQFKVLYCFQAWCPGCHSRGLPALQKMTEALKDNEKVAFLAIQTVFEGSHANTLERVKEIQKEYNLDIPFGHDVGMKILEIFHLLCTTTERVVLPGLFLLIRITPSFLMIFISM